MGTYYHDLVGHLESRLEFIQLLAPQAEDRASHQWFSLPLPGDSTQRLAFPKPGYLKQLLTRLAPEIVLLPTLGPYAYFGMRVAQKLRVATCVAHHTDFEKLASLYWNPAFAYLCRRTLESAQNWLIRRADLVVTMNDDSCVDAQDRGASIACKVGTPIAPSFLATDPAPLDMSPPRVAFIGRLAAEKGIDQILQAAGQCPEMRFTIGGDGPLRRQVELAASQLNNLQYLGWLPRPDVLSTLDASDILVLPSAHETFGTVAMEALARRRLVLVSEACGIAQWPTLARGLFTIGRDESLTEALRRLNTMDHPQRIGIASRGWRAVRAFNESTLDDWLNVFERLARIHDQRTRHWYEAA